MSTWIVLLLSSIASATIGSGIIGMSLGRVVDLVFIVQLCVVALFIVSTTLYLLGQLSYGEAPSIASGGAALFLSLLQPYAAIAGYRLYGWIANEDIVGATFAYIPFAMFYSTNLAQWGFLPSQLLHDPMVLGLLPENQAWLALTEAMRQIELGLVVASLLLSLGATYLLKRREPADGSR